MSFKLSSCQLLAPILLPFSVLLIIYDCKYIFSFSFLSCRNFLKNLQIEETKRREHEHIGETRNDKQLCGITHAEYVLDHQMEYLDLFAKHA